MKNSNLQLDSILKPLRTVLAHHAIIVIFLGLSAIVYAVFTINQLLSIPDDEAYRAEKQADTVKTRFDQDTINKLERLRARQEQMTLQLPAGRIDPFVE